MPSYRHAIWEILGAVLICAALLATMVIGGCQWGEPCRPYIESERGIFDALAPELRTYIGADTAKTERIKRLELDLIDDWEAGLEAFEELLEIKPREGAGQ